MIKTKKVGICFSKEFDNSYPLSQAGDVKLPVYLRLLEFMQNEGWEVYVLPSQTYKGKGIFGKSWLYDGKDFKKIQKPVKMDLVYDRTGGLRFPKEGDSLRVVNIHSFKVICWRKWLSYQEVGKYMPKTWWIGGKENLPKVLPQIEKDWIVMKPNNGLKGIGIYIGPKEKAEDFEFSKTKREYLAQEFIDTSKGIPGITKGKHDLRIVIVNAKITWSHVRTPPEGRYEANVARGGSISEIDIKTIPESVKKVVGTISKLFFEKYDNPIYSLDFGFQDNRPFLFEINDTIGFPGPDMKARDVFLKELVKNFKSKLT